MNPRGPSSRFCERLEIEVTRTVIALGKTQLVAYGFKLYAELVELRRAITIQTAPNLVKRHKREIALGGSVPTAGLLPGSRGVPAADESFYLGQGEGVPGEFHLPLFHLPGTIGRDELLPDGQEASGPAPGTAG